MKTTNVSFRMDEELKKQTEHILDEIGLSMSSAFTVFAKAVVRSGKIPFELTVEPFYRIEHQNELNRRIEGYETGKTSMKELTMDELDVIVNG